jgi:tartrate-resistant acid phosphatase type 5
MPTYTCLLIGDWGSKTSLYYQNKFCVHSRKNIDFYVLLGDNFYPSGVENVMDRQWQEIYKDLFPTSIPSFAILGNHDYILNPHAQILYSHIQPAWKMPYYYYSK